MGIGQKIILCFLIAVLAIKHGVAQDLKLVKKYYNGDSFSAVKCRLKQPNTLYVCELNKVYEVHVKRNSVIYLRALYDGNFNGKTGKWGLFHHNYLTEVNRFGLSEFNMDSIYVLLNQVERLESDATVLARVRKREVQQREYEEKEKKIKADQEERELLLKIENKFIKLKPMIAITVLLISLGVIIFLKLNPYKEKKSPRNQVPDTEKYATRKQLLTISFFTFVSVMSVTWYAIYYLYKTENPYNEPGLSSWIVIFPVGCILFICCIPLLPKLDERETETCPRCGAIYLKKDMLFETENLGTTNHHGTSSVKTDIRDSSGSVVGSFDQQVPTSWTSTRYKYHYKCKSCDYQWTN